MLITDDLKKGCVFRSAKRRCYLIRINEEEAESHDLDEHVLLRRCQVVPVLEHLVTIW